MADDEQRLIDADSLTQRLDRPMGILGIIFLLVPFLRLFRAIQSLRLLRVARFGSVLSAGVRGSRSAERLLSNRVAWLFAVTAIVILAASQLLCIFADYPSCFDALTRPHWPQ